MAHIARIGARRAAGSLRRALAIRQVPALPDRAGAKVSSALSASPASAQARPVRKRACACPGSSRSARCNSAMAAGRFSAASKASPRPPARRQLRIERNRLARLRQRAFHIARGQQRLHQRDAGQRAAAPIAPAGRARPAPPHAPGPPRSAPRRAAMGSSLAEDSIAGRYIPRDLVCRSFAPGRACDFVPP